MNNKQKLADFSRRLYQDLMALSRECDDALLAPDDQYDRLWDEIRAKILDTVARFRKEIEELKKEFEA
jgi:hypothetical protein